MILPGLDPGRFSPTGIPQEPGRSGLFSLPLLQNSQRTPPAIVMLNN
jgi:hypothetical protein